MGDESQLAADHLVQSLLGHQQRNFVQCLRRDVLDDAVGLHVAEQGDFPADVVGDGRVAAAHQNVGLNAQGEQLLHGMLSGLGLQLPGAGDLDDQRNVDEQHIALGPLGRHLADGLQKGLALDIAHGAADFGDDHVHVVAGHDGYRPQYAD